MNKSIFLLTLCFTAFAFNFFGQIDLMNATEVNLRIAYGQKLNRELTGLNESETINWTITLENTIVADGQKMGISLYDFEWENPGNYSLHINSSHHGEGPCNHENHDLDFNVVVSEERVEFKIDRISFSNELLKEHLENGMTMSIPVELSSKNNKLAFDTKVIVVNFQGVGCEVKVQPLSENTIIEQSSFELKYHLQGKVEKDSYIMIDFLDNNGNITTYYHLNKL